METQNNNFPLLFKLERVEKGYILTAKVNTGGITEMPMRKEVVAEDKIDSRIGQLFEIATMVKEHPVTFRVEAVAESTYKMDDATTYDALAEAKLAFVHHQLRKRESGVVLALLIKETQTIEIYGQEAESIAKRNGLSLSRVGGIPMLRFPHERESNKALATYVPQMEVMKVSEKEIAEWYETHRMMIESKR